GDVGRDLDPIRQPDTRHLAESRIRLLRRLGEDTNADAALLWADLERRTLGLGHDLRAPLAHELTDCRHVPSIYLQERLNAVPLYRNGSTPSLKNVRAQPP